MIAGTVRVHPLFNRAVRVLLAQLAYEGKGGPELECRFERLAHRRAIEV
jgi:hypothetical protein